jgi:hypothetical protein
MNRRSDPFAQTSPFDPVRRDLERWRRGRTPGSRIPEPLWKAAIRLARVHGVSRTAIALRLDYYTLKDRLGSAGPGAPRSTAPRVGGPTFLEVPLGLPLQAPGCVLELEADRERRLRVELRGGTPSMIEALARSLWRLVP